MTAAKPTIHARLATILDEMPAIGKDAYNPGLKFNFRSVEQILNELNPLLGKHGVFLLPDVQDIQMMTRPTRNGEAAVAVVKVAYHFVADDGSEVVASSVGEGQDSGDKAVSKAMTMALKTCLGQVFAISTEDDPDGESVQAGRAENRSEQAGPGTSPPAPPAEPWMATKAKVDAFIGSGTPDAEGRREQLVAQLTEQGLPLDLAKATPEQLAAVEQVVADLTEPFLNGHD